MSKLDMIVLSGVVYKIKSSGPSTKPCGTSYESVTFYVFNFTDFCSYFFWKFGTNSFNFINKIAFCTKFHRRLCQNSHHSNSFVTIWSQSYLNDVNSGRADGGILWRMLFMKFHRRRRLSEFSVITSAKYFDLAFVIILLHRWHWRL